MKTASFDDVMDQVTPEIFFSDAAIIQILEYPAKNINLFSGRNYSGFSRLFAL